MQPPHRVELQFIVSGVTGIAMGKNAKVLKSMSVRVKSLSLQDNLKGKDRI